MPTWLQVLPRGPQDLESAFIVLTGTVKVAYGQLGCYIRTAAQQLTLLEASRTQEGPSSRQGSPARGSRPAYTASTEGDGAPMEEAVMLQGRPCESPLLHHDDALPSNEQIAAVRRTHLAACVVKELRTSG